MSDHYTERKVAGSKIMPWGKYQGKRLEEIPSAYLEWCMLQNWLQEDVRDDICDYLKFARKTIL
jgi:hypothetical protein